LLNHRHQLFWVEAMAALIPANQSFYPLGTTICKPNLRLIEQLKTVVAQGVGNFLFEGDVMTCLMCCRGFIDDIGLL